MNRAEIEALAAVKAKDEDISLQEAMESIVKALPPSVRTLNAVEGQSPGGEADQFEFAVHRRLFKAGMMGHAVTLWSSCRGAFPYPPSRLEVEPNVPLIVALDSEDIDDQLTFAASYITGWVESQGGKLQDLRIWLESHQEQ